MDKIEQLEEQMKNLQAQIEELKKENIKDGKKKTPWALEEEEGFCFDGALSGEVSYAPRCYEQDVNCFVSEEVAKGFANAFRVMILLRQCEGAGEVGGGEGGWIIASDGDTDWFSLPSALALCPPFPSELRARVAANSVGIENIKNAYKFLSNIKD